jgi:hypothetical protein
MASAALEDPPEHKATEQTSNHADNYESWTGPPYKYEQLPTPTSIRLLKLLHSPAGEIHCELHTVDLDNDVKFDAISYTWGNPITIYKRPDEELRACNPENADEISKKSGATVAIDSGKLEIVDYEALNYRYGHPSIPYEKVATETDKTYKILCGASTIPVTENLFEALYVFRRLTMREFGATLDGHSDFEEPDLRRPLSAYLWIDAICINQEDILERNSQVRIMARIYNLSHNIFYWIGKEDPFSKRGLFMLSHLFALVHDDPSTQHQWYPSLAQVWPNLRDWVALFTLLQRL